MKEYGIVEKKDNKEISIKIERCASCSHCDTCEFDKNTKEYILKINLSKERYSDINQGDKVELTLSNKRYFLLFFIVFILPVIIMILSYFFSKYFFNNTSINIIISFFGLCITFLILYIVSKKNFNNIFSPKIKKIETVI